MSKAQVKGNEHFLVRVDEEGNKVELIYDPPLLAEFGNLRVELRKELKHHRAHVHIIKKCGKIEYDVSLALDNLDILAGESNISHFNKGEYKAVMVFIIENLEMFAEIYNGLRGDL
jgi:hypothetical protein